MSERDRHVREGRTTGYLLAPEAKRLVDAAAEPMHRILFAMLWFTGAKIGETLDVRAKHVELDRTDPKVLLGRGLREVPIVDDGFQTMLAERLEGLKGSARDRLLPVSRQTASVWLGRHVETLRRGKGFVDFNVTAGTFRTSFAFHAILHAVPLEVLQRWLGHSQAEMTRQYLVLLEAPDTELMRRMLG